MDCWKGCETSDTSKVRTGPSRAVTPMVIRPKAGREHAEIIPARCIHEPRDHVQDREDDQHTDVVPCERTRQFPHVPLQLTFISRGPATLASSTSKGLAASSKRDTCIADHLPPRAAGMPRSSRPAAMARSDSEPAACSSLMVGISRVPDCARVAVRPRYRPPVPLPSVERRDHRQASHRGAWPLPALPWCEPRSCRPRARQQQPSAATGISRGPLDHRQVGKSDINAGLQQPRQEGDRAGKPIDLGDDQRHLMHPRRGQCLVERRPIRTLARVPTLVESGYPDFTKDAWTGVVAPAGTPSDVVDTLNRAINEGLQSAEMRENLARFSAIANPGTPKDFAVFMRSELPKWAELVKLSGATAE